MSDLHERYAASLMNTFGPPKLVLTRGEGARVWDEDGKSYVDLLGGIAVNALGHGHPALVEAVTTQLSTLGHVSNFFATQPQVELAERLLALLDSGPGKVFFANSGAEANEAAIKLTRRTGRTHLVATEGAFHGRTMGALALTAKEAYREPFEPLPGHVTFVPYGDVAALAAAVTDATAAVVLEPVQGEAGVVMPPAGYLAAARRITRERGALLWIDEVQSGVGRTGAWFAHAQPRRRPDPRRRAGRRRRRHPGQGPRRRHPDRRLRGPRGRRGPARPRQPRHHVRRQPGRDRGRPGRAGHHRVRGPARPRDQARRAAPHRPGRRPAGHRGPRRRPADRARPQRGEVRRGHRRRAGGRVHHQQPHPRADPAGAAAGAHRRRRRRVPRRLARHPRRGRPDAAGLGTRTA